MKIGAIVQARTTSTRLPAKVLKELPYKSGITVLQQVVRRLKKSSKLDEIIIATTKDREDDPIVDIANKEQVPFYRGKRDDVLSRYYHAAKEHNLDTIVRITSDCPVIDYNIIDEIINAFLKENVDYATNTLKKTYPHGMDTEVFSFEVLERAYKEAKKDFEREHVTPYIRLNPDKFRLLNIEASMECYGPDIRITIDTEEDYALLCAVYDYLYNVNPYFTVQQIVRLFKEKPWLKLINKKVIQKKIFNSLKEEIKEAIKILDLQDLKRAKKYLEKVWSDYGNFY